MQLMHALPTVSVFRFYPFWINTAVFYYFGASFLLFISRNYIFKTQTVEFINMTWSFHNLNNIIKNILFAIGIYYAGVKPGSNQKVYKYL
ncbi:MAG: hypothetical protein IPJ81_16440 [Chitinophagaceae bacterium]|nr:hypothetical protein [Chitinophagaceae bacterium]